MSEKLQKILAQTGLASRRAIEQWIQAERITVNGKLAHIGERVTHQDVIAIDGKIIKLYKSTTTQVILYHKPVGEICTRADTHGRTTVFTHLPPLKQGRWIAIGRLDLNTSGLLLFTNDGELANKLMHPKTEVEREYLVRVLGQVSDKILNRLQKGVLLEDGHAHFETVDEMHGEGANHWYKVVLKEGRNRLVRRLWESQNLTVSRLIRSRFGSIALPRDLKPGCYMKLSDHELQTLI